MADYFRSTDTDMYSVSLAHTPPPHTHTHTHTHTLFTFSCQRCREIYRQEGWLSPTERASVSKISLRHILASPGYAPGTIAVNVTWMKRGFNAGQTHSNIYQSTFNRVRAIARYLSEIVTFPYPLHLTPPLGCSHWNSEQKFGPQKTRIMGLPGNEDSLTIG